MDLGLDRAHLDAEELGDLPELEVLEAEEDEDLFFLGREAVEGPADELGLLVGLEAKERATVRPAGVLAGWRDWLTFRRPAFTASFSAFLLFLGLGAGWLLNGGRAGGESYAALSREVQAMRQQVALSLLSQPSAADRIQGIGYGAALKDPSDRTLAALFDAVDADPNPNVRLAAIDALYLFRDRPGVRESLVKSLAVQTYPLVQVALIDFLVEVRESRAAEALKTLIAGGELTPEVKARAEQGLKQII